MTFIKKYYRLYNIGIKNILEVYFINKHLVNNEIVETDVRLIDENGDSVGVISLEDALKIAREKGFDLVQLQSNCTPSVCKIMDYKKFLFDLSKKEKKSKKSPKTVTKEVRISSVINKNDLNTKVKSINKFLTNGNKVKILLTIKERGIDLHNSIESLLNKIKQEIVEYGTISKEPQINGKNVFVMVEPDK